MLQIKKQEIDERIKNAMPMQHPWHNRFHLEMPFGLINDPNGLSYYDGEYHIFYQWNPYGCEHKNKCWAHVHTPDFLHYSIPSLALWPSDEHDKDGCYSGSAYVEENRLQLVYTGNAKDDKGKRASCQRLAVQEKDGSFRKKAILISGPPEGYTEHFRDPYVFQRDSRRFMVLGTQTSAERGCVLLYEEIDARWKLLGELKTQLGKFGYMWECPNLLAFPEGDALLFSPQGLEAEEYAFQNLYQSGYVTGKLLVDEGKMVHGPFEELDHGFDFYAPQVLSYGKRHILFGWMGMPEREAEYPTQREGWLYALTMPRELIWKQGQLYSEPVRELRKLRREGSMEQQTLYESAELVVELTQQAELLMDIDAGKAQHLVIELLWGNEKTRFLYDRQEQVMQLDRSDMELGGHGIRKFRLSMEKRLSLQLYMDRTAVESFWQQGAYAASFMVFPVKGDCVKVRVFSDAAMERIEAVSWSLRELVWEK